MVLYKELAIFFIASFIQMNLVQSQWNGGFGYGSYYVPTTSSPSGPVQYVPAQGASPGSSGITYTAQNIGQPSTPYPQNEAFLQNGPFPTGAYPMYGPYPPVYSNTPVSFQGLDQANAVSSAFPNQPVIIINNGGNGDTGGNSNNGNSGGGGLFGSSGINLGDLFALKLASHHHHNGGPGGGPGPDPGPEIVPPPVALPQGISYGSGDFGCGNNRCSTVTNITIILPSSGGSVSVEGKNKKNKEKYKTDKDVDENEKENNKDDDKETKVKDEDSDE